MKEVNKMQRFETQLYQINLKQRDTATVSLSLFSVNLCFNARFSYGDFSIQKWKGFRSMFCSEFEIFYKSFKIVPLYKAFKIGRYFQLKSILIVRIPFRTTFSVTLLL